jgi:DNA-binding Xre family transcriptional regulator
MRTRLKVKEIAEDRGMSMTHLHKKSDVAYTTIRAIFKNPYMDVSLETLRRLGDVLGVPTSELIEDVPE